MKCLGICCLPFNLLLCIHTLYTKYLQKFEKSISRLTYKYGTQWWTHQPTRVCGRYYGILVDRLLKAMHCFTSTELTCIKMWNNTCMIQSNVYTSLSVISCDLCKHKVVTTFGTDGPTHNDLGLPTTTTHLLDHRANG